MVDIKRPRDPEETRRGAGGDESAFSFQRSESDPSIAGLLRDLAHQGTQLAEQQARLMRAEIRSGLSDLQVAGGAMAGAAVVGIAGLGVLLMAISFLLSKWMPLWGATGIVALATLAGAYAMFAGGKRKLQSTSLSMDRTRETIERAPSALAGQHDGGRL